MSEPLSAPIVRRPVRAGLARRLVFRIVWLVGIIAGTMAAAQAQTARSDAAIESIDRVIAVVNDEVITQGELDRAVNAARSRLDQRRERGGLPSGEELTRQVLEALILERARAQHARSVGIVVSETQVDQAVDGIARQNNLTVGQLRERLQGEATSFSQFREQVRAQILAARLRETEVESRIRVSDADVDAWLAQQKGLEQQAGQVDVGQLFLKLPENASPDQIAERSQTASDLLQQLRDGADFARLVASRSESESGLDNAGSLGWRTLDQLPKLFADAVGPLKVGEVSPVVRSPAGLHILKVLDRRGGQSGLDRPIAQTRVRHILIRPGPALGEAEVLRRLESVRDRVLSGQVEFAAMARQYSVDGSAGNGGDLGWVYPGDTVPEFERAMAALAPGQISEPIRTQFGVHLIQVLERRDDVATDDRRRQLARQEVIRQRSELAWRSWLDELRARTYVEYRFEQ